MESTTAGGTTLRPEGPYTWDDFIALDEDDLRELINGELIEVETPTLRHELIVGQLLWYLTSWEREHKSGDVFPSGYKVQISCKRGVMPDAQYYRKGSLPDDAEEGVVGGRPDLAVEVISPSSRRIDTVTKLNWYAQIGVPEYWLIDPMIHSLTRHLLREGHYFVEAHESNEVFEPDTFPGLKIPLAELWQGPRSGTAE